MVGLARRTTATLWEFMDQVDNFINDKDTLHALTELRRKELEPADKKGKASAKGQTREREE